jgi:hypothetical protein
MTRSKRTLNDPRADSDSADEGSPTGDEPRGRLRPESSLQDQVDAQLKVETAK